MKMTPPRARGFRAVEILVAGGLLAVVAYLVLRSCSGEQNLAKQRRTMRIMERAAEVVKHGLDGGVIQPNGADFEGALSPLLQRMSSDPSLARDAWSYPLRLVLHHKIEDRLYAYCIVSPGADGVHLSESATGPFAFGDYVHDLVYCDGKWISYPGEPKR